GGGAWLCRLGAVVPRTFLRPPADVRAARAGGFAAAQPCADARPRLVTRYLVDTNVISATAPAPVVQRPELVEWMDSHSAVLFLSAVIADGIAKAKREGSRRKASDLSA